MPICCSCKKDEQECHNICLFPFDSEKDEVFEGLYCVTCLQSLDAWCDTHGVHPGFQFVDEHNTTAISFCADCINKEIDSMSNEVISSYYSILKEHNKAFFDICFDTHENGFVVDSIQNKKDLMRYVSFYAKKDNLTLGDAVSRLVKEGISYDTLIVQ